MTILEMNVTPTMQRYAAEVHRLQQDFEKVRLSDLSEHIDASVQAVSKMIRKMTEGGFLKHEPYRGVVLTDVGERIAMPALRRHRLAEVFLVQVMGYDWASAHELTDTFELGINAELENRMAELTDYPTHCPHGEPIPDEDGNIVYPDDVSLVEVGEEITCRVSRVRTHDLDKLRYIASLDLVPGTEIHVRGCGPFQGPLRIEVNGKLDQVIGYKLAKVLWVEVNA